MLAFKRTKVYLQLQVGTGSDTAIGGGVRLRSGVWGRTCRTFGRGRGTGFQGRLSAWATWCRSSAPSGSFQWSGPGPHRTAWNTILEVGHTHMFSTKLQFSGNVRLISPTSTIVYDLIGRSHCVQLYPCEFTDDIARQGTLGKQVLHPN